jgi:hypothetical protein
LHQIADAGSSDPDVIRIKREQLYKNVLAYDMAYRLEGFGYGFICSKTLAYDLRSFSDMPDDQLQRLAERVAQLSAPGVSGKKLALQMRQEFKIPQRGECMSYIDWGSSVSDHHPLCGNTHSSACVLGTMLVLFMSSSFSNWHPAGCITMTACHGCV